MLEAMCPMSDSLSRWTLSGTACPSGRSGSGAVGAAGLPECTILCPLEGRIDRGLIGIGPVRVASALNASWAAERAGTWDGSGAAWPPSA